MNKERRKEEKLENLKNLESAFARALQEDKRLAGEIAYVLAIKAHREGEEEKSKYYARECVKIFEELDSDIKTLEDAAARLDVVEGVALPEFIHLNVVKVRFQKMGISYQ